MRWLDRRGRATMIACLIALGAVPAHVRAQPVPSLGPAAPATAQDEARPWATGVPDAEQAVALELYVAGNHEFVESRYARALAKYREALQHWDHPAIRYNMAVCLINLEQPVEAREHLDRGLVYGERPLGADAYQHGLTYRRLLEAQLAHVKITCPEADAEVTLDGKLLLTGPGAAHRFVTPGTHQVVATKPGYQTASQTLVLSGGMSRSYELQPTLERKPRTLMVRRWSAWKPLAVLGGGGGLIAIGALTYLAASGNITTYDQGIDARCPDGCDAKTAAGLSDLNRARSRAETEQSIAFAVLGAGGAMVIAGVVGLIVNQPRVQLEPSRVLPVVAPMRGGATISMRGGF